MSPDHIWLTPSWPPGMSLYIDTVTLGLVASEIAVSPSLIVRRSSADDVLTSVIPARSPTIAMAVCQSSMIAVWPECSGSHRTSYGLSSRSTSWTRSVFQPMPVEYTVYGTVNCQPWSYQGFSNVGQTFSMLLRYVWLS